MINLGDQSTGHFLVVIIRPGLPGHFGLFAQITYKVVWDIYILSWSGYVSYEPCGIQDSDLAALIDLC